MNYVFDIWDEEETEIVSASLDIFCKPTEYLGAFFMIHLCTSSCITHRMKQSKAVLTPDRSGFNYFFRIEDSKGYQNIQYHLQFLQENNEGKVQNAVRTVLK